ncbi:endospore germination permease [Paenibacillus sp. LHD-117]|uniref:GerAB/ArcD/ProY family transporter n=1 Tax=Paenibacillus sp. LHD-117 TaxID=3071412 RepID=UPI0027E1BBAF|nr:endospore germination permease [Paenibacillus sp. LHD-117]MDQ6422440.1 endospore germination permease [Paenibacillus sp. LHD-117]
MPKVQISPAQFAALIVMFVVSSSTLILPTLLATQAKQDAWIAAVVGVSVSMLLILIYGKLGTRFPRQSLVEYSQSLLGKIAGKTLMMLFLVYLFIITSGLLSQVGTLASSLFLAQTPSIFVNLLFFAIIVFAVKLGLETFSRAAQLFLPFILLLMLLLLASLLPLIQVRFLTPMLEFGLSPVIKGAITVVGIPFLDLVILLMVFPSVDDSRTAYKVYFGATAFGGLLLVLVILFSTLVLGPYRTGIADYPFFVLAQKVNIGNFVQRIESIVIAIWMVSLFFKITICYYALLLSAGQIFQLRSYKPLALPIGFIVIALSVTLFPSSISFWEYVGDQWTPSVLLYGLFIPAGLLLVAIAGRKRSE